MEMLEYIDAAFTEHLFVSNVISAALLLGVADLLVQGLEVTVTHRGLDTEHTYHAVIVGAFLGVFNHVWYSLMLNRAIEGEEVTSLLLKILLDQMVAGPFFSSAYMFGMAKLEGKSNMEVYREWQQAFWEIYKADWNFWPFAQLINFSLVPKRFTVLYVNMATLIWDVFLSYKRRTRISDYASQGPPASQDVRGVGFADPRFGRHSSPRKLSKSGVRMISIDQSDPQKARDVISTDQSDSQESRDAEVSGASLPLPCQKAKPALESVLVKLNWPSINNNSNTQVPMSDKNPTGNELKGKSSAFAINGKQNLICSATSCYRIFTKVFSSEGAKMKEGKGTNTKGHSKTKSQSSVTSQTSDSKIRAHVWHKSAGSNSSGSKAASKNASDNNRTATSECEKKMYSWKFALRRLKIRLLRRIEGLTSMISDLSKDVRRMETSFDRIETVLFNNRVNSPQKLGAGDDSYLPNFQLLAATNTMPSVSPKINKSLRSRIRSGVETPFCIEDEELQDILSLSLDTLGPSYIIKNLLNCKTPFKDRKKAN